METLFILGFIALIAGWLVIRQVVKMNNILKRLLAILNLLLWGYEIFFLLAVMEIFPTMVVHLGGGLADMMHFFLLFAIVILHPLILYIMIRRGSKVIYFIPSIVLPVIVLVYLHNLAALGNKSNDYMRGGNLAGLYYDRAAIRRKHELEYQKKQLEQERLEALKPKFNTRQEALIYDVESGNITSAEWKNTIGSNYFNGMDGAEQNYELALEWFYKAATDKYPDHLSWENLAILYFYGAGVEQNYEEAVRWSRMVVECKNLRYENPKRAQYIFGYCLLWGKGVEQDRDEGIKWLKKSAQNGNKDAQEELIGLGLKYE